jgi:hypothetical protein
MVPATLTLESMPDMSVEPTISSIVNQYAARKTTLPAGMICQRHQPIEYAEHAYITQLACREILRAAALLRSPVDSQSKRSAVSSVGSCSCAPPDRKGGGLTNDFSFSRSYSAASVSYALERPYTAVSRVTGYSGQVRYGPLSPAHTSRHRWRWFEPVM